MDPRKASLALSVVHGLIVDAPGAEEMATATFDSLEDAATAYAYLVGYLVQDAADRSGRSVDEIFAELRGLLSE